MRNTLAILSNVVLMGVLGACGRGGGQLPTDIQQPEPVHENELRADTEATGVMVFKEAPPAAPEIETMGDGVPDDRGEQQASCACIEKLINPEERKPPVDVIWFVDTSGSMSEEERLLEQLLNDFAAAVEQTDADIQIIMIGDNNVCVPPPLGGGGCPDTDTDRYLHVRQSVDSVNGLIQVLRTYPRYRQRLRPQAHTHIVAVTDDDSSLNATLFKAAIERLPGPGFRRGFTLHSIVAFGDEPGRGCCSDKGCGSRIGHVYLKLTEQTQGVKAPICSEDWGDVFSAIATRVAESALPCHLDLPELGEGQQLDPARVEVMSIRSGNRPTELPYVSGAGSCRGAGWFWSTSGTQTQIVLCPQSCGAVSDPIRIRLCCD